MPIEIERRFLVCCDEWRDAVVRSERRRQGYLSRTGSSTVRIRRSPAQATITVKSTRVGISRHEFEYHIPLADADHMLEQLCATPLIEKERHWVEHCGMIWEVDVYDGRSLGLVLAEIELDHPEQPFVLPRWVGAEVTNDLRYRSQSITRGLWRTAPPAAPRDRRARANQPARVRRSQATPSPRLQT